MQACDTPVESNCKIGFREENPPVDTGQISTACRQAHLSLSHKTKHSFPVSVMSQFMNKPNEEHLEAVYRILRYLKMTHGKKKFFRKGTSQEVEVYSDTKWTGSIIDRQSTIGCCTFVQENLKVGVARSRLLPQGDVPRQNLGHQLKVYVKNLNNRANKSIMRQVDNNEHC